MTRSAAAFAAWAGTTTAVSRIITAAGIAIASVIASMILIAAAPVSPPAIIARSRPAAWSPGGPAGVADASSAAAPLTRERRSLGHTGAVPLTATVVLDRDARPDRSG